jgi:hypothetical protein
MDPAHDMYQYSLKITPGGLKHLGVYSVNEVVLTFISVFIGFLSTIY